MCSLSLLVETASEWGKDKFKFFLGIFSQISANHIPTQLVSIGKLVKITKYPIPVEVMNSVA